MKLQPENQDFRKIIFHDAEQLGKVIRDLWILPQIVE